MLSRVIPAVWRKTGSSRLKNLPKNLRLQNRPVSLITLKDEELNKNASALQRSSQHWQDFSASKQIHRETYGPISPTNDVNHLKAGVFSDDDALQIVHDGFVTPNHYLNTWLDLSLKVKECDGCNQLDESVYCHEVSQLAQTLRMEHEDLSFDQLKAAVIAFGYWPWSWRNFDILNRKEAINKPEVSVALEDLKSALEKASFDRLYLFGNEEKPHFLWEQVDRLELAKCWVYAHVEADRTNEIFKFMDNRSYPHGFINKCARSTGRSRSLFQACNPKMFLDLCKVVRTLHYLPKDFHKYYAIFKLFEFIEFYDLNATAVILRMFYQKGLHLSKIHPIAKSIYQDTIAKMASNIDHLTDDNFFHIVRYLSNGISLSSEGLANLNYVQQNADLGLPKLISLAALSMVAIDEETRSSRPPNQQLLDRIQKHFDQNEIPDNLHLTDVINFLKLIQHGYLNADECVLEKVSKDLGVRGSWDQRLTMLYLMIRLKFCSESLVKEVLTDKLHTCELENGKYRVTDSVLYSESTEMNEIRRKVCLIIGMVPTYFPSISIDFMDSNCVETLYTWSDAGLPTNRMNQRLEKRDENMPVFVEAGVQLKKSIENFISSHQAVEADRQYVYEATLLPFLGTVEFLIVFDRKTSNFVPIPEDILSKEIHEFKLPTSKSLDWLVIEYFDRRKHFVHSEKNDDFCIQTLEDFGFKTVCNVDASLFRHFDGTLPQLFSVVDERIKSALNIYLNQ